MAFSDAEEDQPSTMQNGATPIHDSNTSNVGRPRNPAQPLESLPESAESQNTNSGTNSASASNLECASNSNTLTSAADSHHLNGTTATASDVTSISQDCGMSESSSIQPCSDPCSSLTSQPASLSCNSDDAVGTLSATLSNVKADSDPGAEVATRESGSESMGTVGVLNGEDARPSMSERLSRHEAEAEQLSTRLRDSLQRREQLMARYQATRERLSNLKRQRMGYVQEERRLLQSVGGPHNPYDDPIPGAEEWSIQQLESGIADFEGLREKVDRLHEAYMTRMQTADEADSTTRGEVSAKMDQIETKKRQIADALSRMAQLVLEKRQGGNAAVPPSTDPTNVPNPEGASNELPSGGVGGTSPLPATHTEGVAAAVGEGSPCAQDIAAKQAHLSSLQEQLANMKKLLDITQQVEVDIIEQNSDEGESDSDLVLASNPPLANAEDGEMMESEVVQMNGRVIHLSDTERRNPEVIAKFQQLSEAKMRLNEMEEIMTKIQEAKNSGKPLTEVLSPENLRVLNAAQEDESEPETPLPISIAKPRLEPAQPTQPILPNHNQRQPTEQPRRTIESTTSRNATPTPAFNRNPVSSTISPTISASDRRNLNSREWESEREISAMHLHIRKNQPGIKPVNEGSIMARSKNDVQKQTRELFGEGATGGVPSGDPRLAEVLTLQEELKEKKNALEALMRRMGKSSSFTFDNISDNISENVSDTSEFGDKPPINQEDEFRLYAFQGEEAPRANAYPQGHGLGGMGMVNSKNRNRNERYNENSFSVNDLSSAAGNSVRPKQNRAAVASRTASSWENVAPSSSGSNKVQNTVAAALSQLAQVQDTINSLYGELRGPTESASRRQESLDVNIHPNIHAMTHTNMMQQPPPANICPQSQPNVIPQIHNSNAIPQIHNSNVIPQIHNSNVIPQIHNSNPIPQIHNSNAIPQIHNSNVIPQIQSLSNLSPNTYTNLAHHQNMPSHSNNNTMPQINTRSNLDPNELPSQMLAGMSSQAQFNGMTPNLIPTFGNSVTNLTGRVDSSSSSTGGPNPVLSGLQQCFSQLYLHSLEIQSLNKHMQVRPPLYPPQYPSYPNFSSHYPYYFPPQPPPSF